MTEYKNGYLYEMDPIGDVPGIPPRTRPITWRRAIGYSLAGAVVLFAVVVVIIERVL
jgi:hypothetical protein